MVYFNNSEYFSKIIMCFSKYGGFFLLMYEKSLDILIGCPGFQSRRMAKYRRE